MNMRRLISGLFLMLVALAAQAAPKAELWPRWNVHDENNPATLDHSDWDAFLRTHVKASADGINRIDYGKVSAQDKSRLNGYLARAQVVPISKYSRAEQRAYWINLYNAATLKVVLDHYPVESITRINISPGFFAKGPWGKKLLKVEGEDVALDDIEHRILRPIWNDPRTHYSVNCASIGCPNLAAKAFTSGNTDELLDAGARAYVNHPRGARVENGKLVVSSIYKWFKPDFGDSDAGVIAHLKKYAEPRLAAQLAGISAISRDEYDWSLNDAK